MVDYKCKNMIDRINLILRAKNITAKQFAEEIGIQPSGMSHILGGRNNPSLDFVSKVLRRYPEIDANWLLLGRGEMYGGERRVESGERRMEGGEWRTESGDATLFDEEGAAPLRVAEPRHEPMNQQEAIAEEERQTRAAAVPPPPAYVPSYIASAPPAEAEPEEVLPPAGPEPSERRVVRLLFIYNDHTYEEYRPR